MKICSSVNLLKYALLQLGYAWSVDRTSKQWIDVGIHTEACMTRPETCGSAGGAVSFWINVVNCTGFQYLGGLITTENAGPGLRIFCHAPSGLLGYVSYVTNYYFIGITQCQTTTELLLASSQSISPLISAGDNSCSWVLVHALGLSEKRSYRL